MPKEHEPDTYFCDIDKAVEDKMVDMVNAEIEGILKFKGMSEVKPLVDAIKHINETIAWVAKGNGELYNKFAFHVFRTHDGTHQVVQGVEIPTSHEPRS